MRTPERVFMGVVVLAVAGGVVQAQGPSRTVLLPAAPLLPEKVGSWVADPGGQAALKQATPTLAAILKEDGLVRSSAMSYAKPGERSPVEVTAYQFGDVTGSVSALMYLRGPEMTAVQGERRIGDQTFSGPDGFLFRSGPNVVVETVHGTAGLGAENLRALSGTLPKASGPKGLAPLLPTYLPAEGLVPGSVRYALGPEGYAAMGGSLPSHVLGFDKAAESVTAEYAERSGGGTMTLLLYPTPTIAGDRGRALEEHFNSVTPDQRGTVKLRREGPLLVLVTGKLSAKDADSLADRVHAHGEVTWNKQMPPEFHTEVRKTASLLVSIATLSGVLMLAAVLLGLFLGGGRAAIRVLMGKPAATEPEFLRLDLRGLPGGSGRPESGLPRQG